MAHTLYIVPLTLLTSDQPLIPTWTKLCQFGPDLLALPVFIRINSPGLKYLVVFIQMRSSDYDKSSNEGAHFAGTSLEFYFNFASQKFGFLRASKRPKFSQPLNNA